MEGAHAGFPFPIPKTGNEAMWNHLVRFNGQAYEVKYRNLNVDANGRPALATEGLSTQEYPFWDNSKTAAETFWRIKIVYSGPDTIVKVDIDKDPGTEMSIFAPNVHLTHADLIL